MVQSIPETADLLREVFPEDPKFALADFLTWEYTRSPSGQVIAAERRDGETLLGHYAVLPQRWMVDGAERPFALSLNTAVSEKARGQGLFTKLATETYELARGRGVDAIVGVANASSTPGFIGKLGFDLVGPLPVSVIVPLPALRRSGVERVAVDDVDDGALVRAVGAVGCVRRWDLSELRWRLEAPDREFSIFRSDEALVVTCRTVQHRVHVAIVTKVIPLTPGASIDLAPFVTAACRHHRAPVALHAGINPSIRARRLPLPDRFKPSPLNLIAKSLVEGVGNDAFHPTRFEFLDFDAY